MLTQAYVMAVDIHINIKKLETSDWKPSADNRVIYMKCTTWLKSRAFVLFKWIFRNFPGPRCDDKKKYIHKKK